jgi:hypothetical protein
MEPTNKEEFIAYCKGALGEPVITVNVGATQADDRLTDCLNFLMERHFDFVHRALFSYKLQQSDITQQYINTDTIGNALGSTGGWPNGTDILTVSKIYPMSSTVGDYIFDLRYQLSMQDFFGIFFNQGLAPYGALANYEMARSYIKTIEYTFAYPCSYTFSKATSRLFLEMGSERMKAGNYILLEAYVAIDIDQYPKIWRDRIFKRYYTAMLKKQWAQNLMKFANVPLPGGAQLNAPALMQDALREIQEIEDDITKMYEPIPDMQIG